MKIERKRVLKVAKRLGTKLIVLDEGSKSSHSDFVSERPVPLKLLLDMKNGLFKHF